MAASTMTSARAAQRRGISPAVRISTLSIAMASMGVGLLIVALRWKTPVTPHHVAWWALTLAFALSRFVVFHIEIRQEAHTYTLSELPLVVGLFFASPEEIALSCVLGVGICYVLQRQQVQKAAFNISGALLDTTIAIVVFRSLTHGSPLDFRTWAVVCLAIAAADTVSAAAVVCAIRWHGGRSYPAAVAMAAAITATVNISLALLAVIVLYERPLGLLFLVVVVGVTSVAYRGYARLTQRFASLQLLYDFTKAVGASMHADAVMELVLSEARTLLRAGIAEVVLADRENGQRILCHRSVDSAMDHTLVRAAESDSVLIEVVRSGDAIIVSRTSKSNHHDELRRILGIRDAIIAPLRTDESIIGAIMVANRLGDVSTFDDGDRRLFATLANHASVAFENGRLIEQLRQEAIERRHEALHDALTGLPNRTLFLEQVEHSLAGSGAAVMLMDLNGFKEVNDTLGHHNGDEVLREVARRLVEVIEQSETVARLGGDEFAIVLSDVANGAEALVVAERIIDALTRPFVVEQLSLEVGASIGIALSPLHGVDAVTLLQRADVAMYEAKSSGRGAVVYGIERDNYSPQRLALASQLRQALENGELTVYYQPKARLDTGEIIGVEALARWHHHRHGFISPDEFIPIAEHTGLISELTVHVLRLALEQCARWDEGGHHLSVAVNLAMRSLLDADLPLVVADALRTWGVSPEQLTLELTESTVMADPTRTISVLERLAAIGVSLSVDDFGTGYSSLAYLRRLPVHEVKVDKSFVFRMAIDHDDATIVQSIVELGHNLGLAVVAEGVEDQISWDRLRAMHCDIAQGYLLSKPVPANEITRWLAERARLAEFGRSREHV